MRVKVGRQDDEVEIEMEIRELESLKRILMKHGNILNNLGQERGQERCRSLREKIDDELREARKPSEDHVAEYEGSNSCDE